MRFADRYLSEKGLQAEIYPFEIIPEAGIIIVIPAFFEKNLHTTLKSLKEAYPNNKGALVLVVINHPEQASEEIKIANQAMYLQTMAWMKKNSSPGLSFHAMYYPDMPAKHGGVGLARKKGMDTACAIFNQQGNPDGVIVALDADTIVEKNYLQSIEQHFSNNPKSPAANIHFEHILPKKQDSALYLHISQYELHLRYYVEAQKYCALPFAFHTVGSAFCVKAGVYSREGGMNRKKAGEDFYFLQKILRLGNFSKVKGTTIYPSARTSFRVPFGTGASALKFIQRKENTLYTYNLQSLIDVNSLTDGIAVLYKTDDSGITNYFNMLAQPLKKYLAMQNFKDNIKEMQTNSASEKVFKNRFFTWFNGFRLMRFLNESHPESYQFQPVATEAKRLLELYKFNHQSIQDPVSLLKYYRELQKDEV